MPLSIFKKKPAISENSALTFLKGEIGKLRIEKFKDQDHTVIPVIALIEGVHHAANSPNAELALATEFGRFPMTWNGRPVTIDHPQVRGEFVSANSPKVLEDVQVGFVFNPLVEDKKLKLEAWIDESTLNENGTAILQKVKDGEITEVSVGVFTEIEKISGNFEGKDFTAIWRNVVPDHLALLSEGSIGACSNEEGCGTNRVNQTFITNCACNNPSIGKSLEKANVQLIFRGNKDLNDQDRRAAAQAALDLLGEMGFVIAVFNNVMIIDSFDGLFSRDFSISDDGTIILGSEKVRVRPETQFVEVKLEISEMDKKEKVSALISCKGTKFEESHREWLMTLSEDQLDLFEAEEPTVPVKEPTPAAEESKSEPKANEEKKPKTLEEFISDAPQEIGRVLRASVNQYNTLRDQLVSEIKANAKNKFTEDQLKAMDMEMLQNIVQISGIQDFSARGGPRANSESNVSEFHAPPPRKLFSKVS